MRFVIAVVLLLCGAWTHAEEKIHLVWLQKPNFEWSSDWIHELLSQVDAPVEDVFDYDFNQYLDRAILVFGWNVKTPPTQFLQYIQQYNALGLKYVVIHLSDEAYTWPMYSYNEAPPIPFVFRNYWHKHFEKDPHVLCFPVGYKSGFWSSFSEEIPSSEHRPYLWSFAGELKKSTRPQMMHSLKPIDPHYVHEIFGFGDAVHSLSSPQYRDLLLGTVFAPCPRGNWNLDSFRISEALEAGCIPIVEKSPIDYFKSFYGDNPFLAVSSWQEAYSKMRALIKNPAALEAKRKECSEWWLGYKESLKTRFAHIIDSQLCYSSSWRQEQYAALESPYPYHMLDFGSNERGFKVVIEHMGRKPKRAMTVGSYLGFSSKTLSSLMDPDGVLYAIDWWKGLHYVLASPLPQASYAQAGGHAIPEGVSMYDQFLSNMIHLGLTQKVVPVRATTQEAASFLRNRGVVAADLVYIDADHGYSHVLADCRAYFPFVKGGKGILCGDDWGWSNDSLGPDYDRGVQRAVTQFAGENDLILHIEYGYFWWLEERKHPKQGY